MVRRLRRTKKKQKYNYNRNRRRLNKTERSTGTIKCLEIKNAIDSKKNLSRNIRDMGLAYNVNRVLPVPNAKKNRVELTRYVNGFLEEDVSDGEETPTRKVPPKIHVAQELEREANEYVESRFRLPKGQVKFVSQMIDAYGFNYREMSRDRNNHDQDTWRQLRQKVRKFLSIPDQCTPYLERKGWLDCDMDDPSDPRWKEYGTDDEEC